ncbi:MAG: hypothetical protein ACM4D3_18465 [Candidatus Sericytochromatia bacterium]
MVGAPESGEATAAESAAVTDEACGLISTETGTVVLRPRLS